MEGLAYGEGGRRRGERTETPWESSVLCLFRRGDWDKMEPIYHFFVKLKNIEVKKKNSEKAKRIF